MKILVIPDTQITPNSTLECMQWAANYIIDKRPDVVVHLGDHWDMPSLCSYDYGKKSAEGRRIKEDIEAGNIAMKALIDPIKRLQKRQIANKKKVYKPRMVFTLGNHENRINRAIDDDAKLEGLVSLKDLYLDDWEVHDFLDPVFINGVGFCHYFTSGVMGRPVTSARALVTKKMQSCVMGHVQSRDIFESKRADGKPIVGLFAGIYYKEDQGYLNPQTNNDWRGLWMLHEVDDGSFDYMPVSLNYLERQYG